MPRKILHLTQSPFGGIGDWLMLGAITYATNQQYPGSLVHIYPNNTNPINLAFLDALPINYTKTSSRHPADIWFHYEWDDYTDKSHIHMLTTFTNLLHFPLTPRPFPLKKQPITHIAVSSPKRDSPHNFWTPKEWDPAARLDFCHSSPLPLIQLGPGDRLPNVTDQLTSPADILACIPHTILVGTENGMSHLWGLHNQKAFIVFKPPTYPSRASYASFTCYTSDPTTAQLITDIKTYHEKLSN